jgi:hypothetical protein
MHPDRVHIAGVIAVTVVVGISAIVRTYGSLLLGDLFLIEEVVVLPSGGRLQAQAAVIGVVTPPVIFWLGRHLIVVFPLHASNALQSTDRGRDSLLLDMVARCD